MKILKAVVWTRVNGSPEKMGDLSLINTDSIFSYHSEYNGAGFSLLGGKELWGDTDISYPASERVPVSPPLINHIPGRNPRNMQRSLLLDVIKKEMEQEPPPTIETEWKLLHLGGHGGIGHLDIFKDDLEAQRFYQREQQRQLSPASSISGIWNLVKRNVRDQALEIDTQAIALMGATPSVGGMIPKMLASMKTTGNELYQPDTQGMVDYVIKFEAPEYKGLMELEALCLDVHQQAGIKTATYKRFNIEGIETLAVKRFDRDAMGNVRPLETLFSLFASSDHLVRSSGDVTLEGLGNRLQKARRLINLSKDSEEKLYQRILFAYATGNGDLHLQNTSILGAANNCELSPVYDPAPMRAWPRHNLASAIPYNPENKQPFLNIGRRFGLTTQKAKALIKETLENTAHFSEQIHALITVPDERKQHLTGIVKLTRESLQKQLIK